MRLLVIIILSAFFNTSGAQIHFEEVASKIGINVTYGVTDSGGGMSFVDFNNDGWDDITFASQENNRIYFFLNKGGVFEEIDLGIINILTTKQILWVDYDNDGDKDLFVTSTSGQNRLYKNTGNLEFEDISHLSGLFFENLYSTGAAFGDIDNDGDLDLFICNRDINTKNQHNYLYINENGKFNDITESAGISLSNDLSYCAAIFDFDNDGYQDIYVANDRYTTINRLYKNNGNQTFSDISESSGAGIMIDAMSTTISDIDGDGWFDIYVTNTEDGNFHLQNNGDGTFTNIASSLGITFNSTGWGAVFLDAENDADLDLYVSGSRTGANGTISSAFYQNTNNHFSIPQNIGFENDKLSSYSNTIGDLNNDGLMDIVVVNQFENNFIWQNTSQTLNNWLKIQLQGTVSNTDAIGSKIEVSVNGKSQFRYLLCGEGYLAQNSNIIHFGLGDSPKIDYVRIYWPSGHVDQYDDLLANYKVKMIEGVGLINSVTNQNDKSFSIYPNPSTGGEFYLLTNEFKSVDRVQIFNSKAQLIFENTGIQNSNSLLISDLDQGVYLVKVWFKNTASSRIVVVE